MTQRREGFASFGAIAQRAVQTLERETHAKTDVERLLIETSRAQWAALAAPRK